MALGLQLFETMKSYWLSSILVTIAAAFVAVDCAYAQKFGDSISPQMPRPSVSRSGAKGEILKSDLKKMNQQLHQQITGQKWLNLKGKIVSPKQAQWLKLEGGVDTGGGTLVKLENGIGLLDLYLHNRTVFYDNSPPLLLPETHSFRAHGIELLKQDSEIFQKTLQTLAAWEELSPLLMDNLKKALINLPVYYISGSFSFVDSSYEIPSEAMVSLEALQLGALYFKDVGVLIVKKDFEKLSEKNQIALLIHEALRHQQISFGNEGLNNNLLQKLTAKLMEPLQVSLDNVSYLYGEPLMFYKAKPVLVEKTKKLGQELCSEFSITCDLIHIGDDIGPIVKSVSKAVSEINYLRNNTEDYEVGMRAQRALSGLFGVWGELISSDMSLDNQKYREALFSLTNASSVAVQRLNKSSTHQSDSDLSLEVLAIVNKLRQQGLLQ